MLEFLKERFAGVISGFFLGQKHSGDGLDDSRLRRFSQLPNGGVKRRLTSPTASGRELRTGFCLIVKEEPFCKEFLNSVNFFFFLIDVYSQSCNQTKKKVFSERLCMLRECNDIGLIVTS